MTGKKQLVKRKKNNKKKSNQSTNGNNVIKPATTSINTNANAVAVSDDSFLEEMFSDAIDEFENDGENKVNDPSGFNTIVNERNEFRSGLEILSMEDYTGGTAVAGAVAVAVADTDTDSNEKQEVDEGEDHGQEAGEDIEEILTDNDSGSIYYYNAMSFENLPLGERESGDKSGMLLSDIFERLRERRNRSNISSYYLVDRTNATATDESYYGRHESSVDLDEVPPDRLNWLNNVLFQDPYYFIDYFNQSLYE